MVEQLECAVLVLSLRKMHRLYIFSFLQIGAVPLAALGAPTLDPTLAALGLPGANLNSQVYCF